MERNVILEVNTNWGKNTVDTLVSGHLLHSRPLSMNLHESHSLSGHLRELKHGASLHNQAEGLSLSVTNPSETISLVENWNQLAYFGVAWFASNCFLPFENNKIKWLACQVLSMFTDCCFPDIKICFPNIVIRFVEFLSHTTKYWNNCVLQHKVLRIWAFVL